MANVGNIESAAQDFAQVTRDSYEKVMGHVVAMQERNVRFTRGVMSDTVEEMRQRVEANRVLALKLVERAEKQRDDLRVVVDESLDAYMDLMFAPVSYYREGLETVARARG